jgi:ATP-binding cassette, subfamily F, member 3
VVWQRPNLLVLDEPTNHLDLDMRHAMEVALQAYEGALILVSHDRHMLRNTVEELLLVHAGQVEEYSEDLEGYERWILSSYKQAERPSDPSNDSSRREKRQQAAAQRDKLRPLKKRLDKNEAEMASIETELGKLQTQLGDTDLHTPQCKDDLAGLLKREGELKARSEQLEESWLDLQQNLEELQNP